MAGKEDEISFIKEEEAVAIDTPKKIKDYEETYINGIDMPDDIVTIAEQLVWLKDKIGEVRAEEIENVINQEMHVGRSARYKQKNNNENEMTIGYSCILKEVKNSLEEAYAVKYAESIGVNIKSFYEVDIEGNFINISNPKLYDKNRDAISLNEDEQKELFIRLSQIANKKEFAEEKKEIIEKLFRANIKLPLSMNRILSKVPFDSKDEREQAAMMGLTKAITGYDYNSGFKFSTYAHKIILFTVIAESERDSRSASRNVYNKQKGMAEIEEKVTEKFLNEMRRSPTEEELLEIILQEIELTKAEAKRVKDIENFNETPESFDEIYEAIERQADLVNDDEKFNEDNLGIGKILDTDLLDTERYESNVDAHISDVPSSEIHKHEFREIVESMLLILPERERKCLELRFGFNGGEPMTLAAIGKEAFGGISQERVRQIEARALRRLKHPVRSRELKDISDDALTR